MMGLDSLPRSKSKYETAALPCAPSLLVALARASRRFPCRLGHERERDRQRGAIAITHATRMLVVTKSQNEIRRSVVGGWG